MAVRDLGREPGGPARRRPRRDAGTTDRVARRCPAPRIPGDRLDPTSRGRSSRPCRASRVATDWRGDVTPSGPVRQPSASGKVCRQQTDPSGADRILANRFPIVIAWFSVPHRLFVLRSRRGNANGRGGEDGRGRPHPDRRLACRRRAGFPPSARLLRDATPRRPARSLVRRHAGRFPGPAPRRRRPAPLPCRVRPRLHHPRRARPRRRAFPRTPRGGPHPDHGRLHRGRRLGAAGDRELPRHGAFPLRPHRLPGRRAADGGRALRSGRDGGGRDPGHRSAASSSRWLPRAPRAA